MTQAALARLLLVDADAAHLRALCDTLRALDYEVEGCAGAAEALRALQAAPFDLVLTELQLPDADGLELLRLALATDAALAIVVMTGAEAIDTAILALESGAFDFLLKPFHPDYAARVLARVLRVQAQRLP